MNSGVDFTVLERFLRYVQIDTQSDPECYSSPSTEKQKHLSNLLAKELLDMGIVDAQTDEYGYVYASIPSNTQKVVPIICFCAHIDTAPDCSGTDVRPILHHHYNGKDILLPDDPEQFVSSQRQIFWNRQNPQPDKHFRRQSATATGQVSA